MKMNTYCGNKPQEFRIQQMTLAGIAARLDGISRLSRAEEQMLEEDRRYGAQLLLKRYRQRVQREEDEYKRLYSLMAEERIFWNQGVEHVAGVDEAGRGPLAGPVVAAAVILSPETIITGLNDSKQLTEEKRELLYDRIMDGAKAVGIGAGSVAEIEKLNIFMAAMLSMRRALANLKVLPGVVLVDGYPIREIPIRQKAIIRGDRLSLSIAAASIIAKVTRDRYMLDLHDRYPVYGFNRHKGYATGEHRRALADYGPCPEHRLSFNLMGRETEGADF